MTNILVFPYGRHFSLSFMASILVITPGGGGGTPRRCLAGRRHQSFV